MQKNKILFYSFAGKNCSDSPRYIAEYLDKNYPNQFKLAWAVNDLDKWKSLENQGWKIIKYKSIQHIIESITSKFIVTNMGPFKGVTTRKDQEIINTWHGGGAYKKSGMDNPYKNKYMILNNKKLGQVGVTLFVSSSKVFTKYLIRGAFDYQNEVIECGLPRNDILVQNDNQALSEVATRARNSLGINVDEHLVLYAPTWRNYDMSVYETLDVDKVISALESRFGGKWRFAFRGHNLSKGIYLRDSNIQCINATDYPDMQELLITADVLISDYSSCIWDFSLTKKFCLLFTPDLELYDSTFAFYTPINQWGFPVCKTNETLVEEILNFNEKSYLGKLQENHKLFENCETGEACKLVTDYIVRKAR